MDWNRPKSGKSEPLPHRKKGRLPLHGIVAAAIVATCGVAGWLVFAPSGETPAQDGRRKLRGKIRSAMSASMPTVASVPTNAAAAKVAEPEYKLIRAVTNMDGAVVQDVVMPDGSLKMIVKPPRQVWHNAADQLIAMTLSIEPGMTAAPFPTGVTDDEFRHALKKEIVIYGDDPPNIRELKLRVREARNEILDIMNKTHKGFEEVLQEHRAEMNSQAEAYRDAVRGLSEVRKNGTDEDMREYVTVMNAALRQVGAKELPVDDVNRPPRRGRRTISTKGTEQ